jgi:hypothetical protein
VCAGVAPGQCRADSFRVEVVAVLAKGWSNGSPQASGAGYGLRIAAADRDRFFEPEWRSVDIELGTDEVVVVPLSDSFWRECTELRSAALGRWLLRHGLAPWPVGAPPRLRIEPLSGNRFRLEQPA